MTPKPAVAAADPAPRNIILALLVLLIGFYLPALLVAPFGRDQGIFAWMAEGLLQGKQLYHDVWDHKGPLVALLYAGVFKVAGVTTFALRMFDQILFVVALAALVWRRGLAGWGSAFFFLLLVNPDWWRSGQPDLWAADFFILAVALGERKSAKADLLAGFLLGLTIWIKPLYLLLAVPYGVRLLWRALRGSWAQDRQFLAAALGFLLPALALMIFVSEHALLSEMLDAMVTFNLSVHGTVGTELSYTPPLTSALIPLSSWADPLGWSAYTIAALALLGLPRCGWYGAALLLVSWACISVQRHFAYYHYLPFFAALAWVAGEGFARLVDGRRFALLAVTLIIILQTPFMLLLAKNAVPFWQGQTIEAVARPEGFSYAQTKEAADQVAALTTPSDTVYLWGYDALLFFLSHRQSASRYGFNYPVRVDPTGARKAEVMGQITLHPPKLIVVQTADSNSLLPNSSAAALPTFPELQAELSDRYTQIWQNDGYIIYQRR